jgi:hypothetical protein
MYLRLLILPIAGIIIYAIIRINRSRATIREPSAQYDSHALNTYNQAKSEISLLSDGIHVMKIVKISKSGHYMPDSMYPIVIIRLKLFGSLDEKCISLCPLKCLVQLSSTAMEITIVDGYITQCQEHKCEDSIAAILESTQCNTIHIARIIDSCAYDRRTYTK